MKKTKTLKKNYEFKRILTKGKHLSGKYIECFYINNKVKNNNFIGIAVSSKIAKAKVVIVALLRTKMLKQQDQR